VRVGLASVNAAAWIAALVFATEFVDMGGFGSFLVFLVGAILLAPAAVLAAALMAYSFSKEGNRLVSGLIGYGYLTLHTKDWREGGREYDLGDGKMGRVVRTTLLQTTFELADGGTETISNAQLMKQWFKMGETLT
jgi:hypothetical protein